MKIVIGKFSNEPFHALSKKELSLLFKIVPIEWTKHISSVVLSSKIFKKIKSANPVEYKTTSKQLSIFSRGLDREYTANQVLLELAKLGEEFDVTDSKTPTEHAKLVKPYLDKFLKARI